MTQSQTSKHRAYPRITTALVVISALALFTPSFASAQGTDTQRRAAIASAMEQAGGYGKVLSVKPYQTDGNKPGFRIRVLTDGKVRTFDVAAEQSQ